MGFRSRTILQDRIGMPYKGFGHVQFLFGNFAAGINAGIEIRYPKQKPSRVPRVAHRQLPPTLSPARTHERENDEPSPCVAVDKPRKRSLPSA